MVVEVTRDGVTVLVCVAVFEGRVTVTGVKVVSNVRTIVIVAVVVGVVVTLKTAVGVAVTVDCKPAVMRNVRMYAKSRPSIMTIQSPVNMLLLSTTFLATLQIDVKSSPSGAVPISEQKYSSPLGSIRRGVMLPSLTQPVIHRRH